MSSKWRFKRAFVDPKNGDIRLYYLREDGHSRVLMSNKSNTMHDFMDVPEDFPVDDAQRRIKVLISEA